MALAVAFALAKDYITDHKDSSTSGGETKILEGNAPYFAVCMTTLDKNGQKIWDWDQINTLDRFNNRRQSMDKRFLEFEFRCHGLTWTLRKFTDQVVTRFKDLTCSWVDWDGLHQLPICRQAVRGDINFTLRFRFDENTERVHFVPMRPAEMVLADEDFAGDSDITDLLRKSSQVSMRIDRVDKDVYGVDTKLCPKHRHCMLKCLVNRTVSDWNAVPYDLLVTGDGDLSFTNAAKQFLPHCLPQCKTKHCTATTFKRTTNIEVPNVHEGRTVVEVEAKMQFPNVYKKLFTEQTSVRSSLDYLIAIVIFWALIEIIFFLNFSVTPFLVAILSFYIYYYFENVSNSVIYEQFAKGLHRVLY